MAKKTAKKSGKAPAAKAAKTKKVAKKTPSKPMAKPAKAAPKPAAKAAPAKAGPASKAASKTAAPGTFEVKTGGGPAPLEIGQGLVAMFNRGEWKQIEERFWSPAIESVEGLGVQMGWRGKAAVDEKNAGWMADHVVHGASAEGPYVGSTGFAVKFRMDVETKSTGTRDMMEEVGVYTVQDGKIVREEFMYLAAKPA
jgi:hypothetical protein